MKKMFVQALLIVVTLMAVTPSANASDTPYRMYQTRSVRAFVPWFHKQYERRDYVLPGSINGICLRNTHSCDLTYRINVYYAGRYHNKWYGSALFTKCRIIKMRKRAIIEAGSKVYVRIPFRVFGILTHKGFFCEARVLASDQPGENEPA